MTHLLNVGLKHHKEYRLKVMKTTNETQLVKRVTIHHVDSSLLLLVDFQLAERKHMLMACNKFSNNF
jgi:hypothetical protein